MDLEATGLFSSPFPDIFSVDFHWTNEKNDYIVLAPKTAPAYHMASHPMLRPFLPSCHCMKPARLSPNHLRLGPWQPTWWCLQHQIFLPGDLVQRRNRSQMPRNPWEFSEGHTNLKAHPIEHRRDIQVAEKIDCRLTSSLLQNGLQHSRAKMKFSILHAAVSTSWFIHSLLVKCQFALLLPCKTTFFDFCLGWITWNPHFSGRFKIISASSQACCQSSRPRWKRGSSGLEIWHLHK